MDAAAPEDPVADSLKFELEMPAATKFKVSTYEEDRHAEDYSNMVKLQGAYGELGYDNRNAYTEEESARKRYATDWEHVRSIEGDPKDLIEHTNLQLDS